MKEPREPRRRREPRQPQQERSAETRMRLIEATIDCLSKFGYSETSTALIARTAGVTRGAYLHHFGSREQLITEALGHMLNTIVGELEQRAVKLFREGRQAELLDEIWRAGFRDWLYAGYEMLLRSRHDEELRRHWAVHSAQFLAWRRRAFSELVGTEIVEDSEILCLLDGFLDLMRGMCLMDVVRTQAMTRAQLDFWRGVFDREFRRIMLAKPGETGGKE